MPGKLFFNGDKILNLNKDRAADTRYPGNFFDVFEGTKLETVINDSLSADFADAGQSLQEPGFRPVDIYFLGLYGITHWRDMETEARQVRIRRNTAAGLDKGIQAIGGTQRINARSGNSPIDIYFSIELRFSRGDDRKRLTGG